MVFRSVLLRAAVLAVLSVGLMLANDAVPAAQGGCVAARLTQPATIRLGSNAQSFGFDVSGTGQTTYDCTWVPVTSDAPWLTTGFVYFAPGAPPGFFGNFPALVAENTSGVARTGHFTFNNGMGTITVIQDAAACVIVPASVQAPREGGIVMIPVQTTTPDCAWSAPPDPSGPRFAAVTGPLSQFSAFGGQAVGPSSVVLNVESNVTGTGPRSMNILVGGVPVRLDQEAPLCVFALSPATATIPPGGATGTLSLTGTGSDCSYTATATGALAIVSGATGIAPATIAYSVGPNPAAFLRPGLIRVGGATFSITQDVTSMRTNRFALGFAYYTPPSGPPFVTAPVDVTVTNAATPAAGWSATSNQPWLIASPASGTGPGQVRLSIDPVQAALLPRGTSAASVVLASADASQGSLTLPVSLFVADNGNTTLPTGVFDTPTGFVTVSGAIPVTGWVLDDVGVVKVTVSRAAVTGEAGSEIYIGDAVRVRGARPDRLGPWPEADDAGWGYMLLTNVLPNGGTGTFTLFADAYDRDGRVRRLGTKTITVDNATAIRPFGTIDEPAQGATVSGTFVNRGWVLTPAGKSIPLDGSTIKVYIDGVLLGPVSTYNHPRPDVKAYFPNLANSDGPEAQLSIDTTTLANGVHTIAWGVIDSNGVAEGIGSRYFTVANGAGSIVAAADAPAARAADALAGLPRLRTDVWSREGVDETGWAVRVEPQPDGSRRVIAPQGQRLEIFLDPTLQAACGTYGGHLIAGGVAAPLPMGASLDRQHGIFRWQPGAEVAGDFAFVFVQRGCDGVERRVPVRVSYR